MKHRIKELIKEKGYTQQEFANLLGMSRVGLAQIVNGKPSYPTLEKIAAALNVEIWELFASRTDIVEESGNKVNTIACPYCGKEINIELSKAEKK